MLRRIALRPVGAAHINALGPGTPRQPSAPPAALHGSSPAAAAAAAGARAVDLDGLRAEAARVFSRASKRLEKARARAAACEQRKAELLADPAPSDADLMALPNCDELAAQEAGEGEREAALGRLVEMLAEVDGPAHPRAGRAIELAAELQVNDFPPERPPPAPRKPKGPPASKGPRLPYRTYVSAGGAEIRVGRTAAENDRLSCDAEHRDADDWWMHASGCPGSHVVIRASTLADGELPREVEVDAAMLATKYSKANPGGTVAVTLCRARQVRKPAGAKPGLVQLSGAVRVVKVAWSKEQHRLDRLEATAQPPSGQA
ncbi:hypothetical protein KFE25_007742 [Diacronema lutheri]|uniref:NFACT RNA-binding domain-containing protein n=1 Tax=Diacronema lutheri TaxID=2081491 RepID=A0A8J6CE24_DIALT|nr:hypothetical protein KFE25_007742 [Diacronema lutheri]